MPAAFRMSADPTAPVVIPALIAILFAAVSVNVLADAQTIGSTTVILPSPVPAALVVVTMTFAPANAVVSVPVVSNES